MSDLSTHQHDVTNEELSRIADAVEGILTAIKEQASTERTVQLEPVLGGPAVDDLVGYAVLNGASAFVTRGLHAFLGGARIACESYEGLPIGPFRVVAVYDLPQEVPHA